MIGHGDVGANSAIHVCGFPGELVDDLGDRPHSQVVAGPHVHPLPVAVASALPTVTVTPPSSSATPETGRASSPTWRQASMPARQVRSALAGPSPAFPRLSVLAVPAPAPCPLSRL
jgi:hypothetical protein